MSSAIPLPEVRLNGHEAQPCIIGQADGSLPWTALT
jgi:hypothetical protein